MLDGFRSLKEGKGSSFVPDEEYINQFKNTLLSNIITIKSNKLIENNKDNFYAYSDKKKEIFSFIIQNKDSKKEDKLDINNNITI